MDTHRKTGTVAAGLLVATALVLGLPRAASAQDAGCDRFVDDGAGVLHEPSAVADAADRLQRQLGATVRVRTLATIPGGDVEAAERRLEAACAGWRRTDGGRRDDLLVVVVGPADRKTGIYYGRGLQARLDPVHDTVQTGTMNPRFQAGDFDGGLTAGLDALARPAPTGAPDRHADALTTLGPRLIREAGHVEWEWVVAGLVALSVVRRILLGPPRRRGRRSSSDSRYSGFSDGGGSSGGGDGGGGSSSW